MRWYAAGGPAGLRVLMWCVGGVAFAIVGWLWVSAILDSGSGSPVTGVIESGSSGSTASSQPAPDIPSTTMLPATSTTSSSTTTSVDSSSSADDGAPLVDDDPGAEEDPSPGGEVATTTNDDEPSTTETGGPSADPDLGVSYPTLPDGSPLPVLTIFDVDTITLSGMVPSDEAAQWLETLALANSKFPDAEIVSSLVVNPDVPISVGVRVVELNSVRFPEGSAEILPEHAIELDRVAGIMELFENVSVLVIGHADQRGSAESNFRLSERRAQSVVGYLAGQGIEPSRLASRAVGESDLITLDDDDAALALNRRTEFVFYGLLVT